MFGIADVGTLFFALPFIAFIAKALFCSVADHYSIHKKVFIIFILLTLTGYGLLLSVPFLKSFLGTFSWYYFCLLVLLANSSMGVVVSITDFLVMKQVTQDNGNFGLYRVFGTFGWGLFGKINHQTDSFKCCIYHFSIHSNQLIQIFIFQLNCRITCWFYQ